MHRCARITSLFGVVLSLVAQAASAGTVTLGNYSLPPDSTGTIMVQGTQLGNLTSAQFIFVVADGGPGLGTTDPAIAPKVVGPAGLAGSVFLQPLAIGGAVSHFFVIPGNTMIAGIQLTTQSGTANATGTDFILGTCEFNTNNVAPNTDWPLTLLGFGDQGDSHVSPWTPGGNTLIDGNIHVTPEPATALLLFFSLALLRPQR